MTKTDPLLQLLFAFVMATLLVGGTLRAAAEEVMKEPWMPSPAKARGGKCDADPHWMRKWHMNVLLHKRDETMHEGIRTPKYSLKRCVTCHAVKDEKTGKFVTIEDSRHFCRTCHDYAAVNIDCFGCHTSLPEDAFPASEGGTQQMGAHEADTGGRTATTVAELKKYFKGEGK